MESVARPLRFILLAFLNHLFGKKETVGVTPPTLAPTIAFLFHLRGCGKFEYVEIRHILALWLLTYDVYRHVSCRHIKSKKDRLCSILAKTAPPPCHLCLMNTSAEGTLPCAYQIMSSLPLIYLELSHHLTKYLQTLLWSARPQWSGWTLISALILSTLGSLPTFSGLNSFLDIILK